MFNVNDESLPPILRNSIGPHPIRDPGELEEILETALDLVDSPDFRQAVETHGEIVLACAYAELADKLAHHEVSEETRVAIARLGRDRKLERADELFTILRNSER